MCGNDLRLSIRRMLQSLHMDSGNPTALVLSRNFITYNDLVAFDFIT